MWSESLNVASIRDRAVRWSASNITLLSAGPEGLHAAGRGGDVRRRSQTAEERRVSSHTTCTMLVIMGD